MFYSVHTNVARGLKKKETLEKFNADKITHIHICKRARVKFTLKKRR